MTPAGLAAPAGLCATCAHRELVASERSVFVRCALAASDERYPRYPRLPVVACRGYLRLAAEAADIEEEGAMPSAPRPAGSPWPAGWNPDGDPEGAS